MNTLPLEFEKRLQEIMPQRPEGMFAVKRWQSFRINTLKISIDQAMAQLAGAKIAFKRAPFCPYAIVVDKETGRQLLQSELVAQGLLYSQGLESMLAVMALDPKPGERVLDLCAAPGSKTSQIAMHMNNQGQLKANEVVRQRFYKLRAVLELTGARANVSMADGRGFKDHEGFDRILVDAPCSSEGRFCLDDPKSFAFWSLRKINEMSHKQKGLLMNAGRLLKDGGTMVYATCTFAPEENEEVLDWFLRKNEGRFEILPIPISGIQTYSCLTQWKGRAYDPKVAQSLRVWPDEGMEGFFIAKLKKSHYK